LNSRRLGGQAWFRAFRGNREQAFNGGAAMAFSWKDQRVLLTGGSGFAGRHVAARLLAAGAGEVAAPRSAACDLRRQDAVESLFAALRPTLVIHLAARVGGIGANRENPGSFYFDNAMMGLLVAEESRRSGVEKLVAVGTVCAYPKHAPAPFREEDLWNGYPEETNAPYGLAKKALLAQLQAYRAQYGFNGVYLLPANLFGPGDNFDPRSSHVVPALVRKCAEARDAGADHVVAWGTGRATREFLYVDDCAEAILLAAEKLETSEPVNLGTGREIAIRDLAEKIAALVGFEGEIRWDSSQPDGQPRRQLDTSRAERLMGWRAKTSFEDGLAKAVAWWMEQTAAAR